MPHDARSPDSRSQVTDKLVRMSQDGGGDRPAADALAPLVYAELRRMAGALMVRERRNHTLDATALVHEAYVRLVDQSRVNWQGRSHFFAVAAGAMRRLLVDHARGKLRAKRGGDWQRASMESGLLADDATVLTPVDLLAVHDALARLATLDPRQARVTELRFFGGLTVRETAEHLGVSARTVEGDWTHARAWLRRALAERAEA